MGFLSPKPPPMPAVAPPPKQEATREEAELVGERERKRRLKESSYQQSIRGGAVNPAYATGTKTQQGQ